MTTNSPEVERDFKHKVWNVSAILTYHPLDRSIMRSLVDKELALLNQRLKMKRSESRSLF